MQYVSPHTLATPSSPHAAMAYCRRRGRIAPPACPPGLTGHPSQPTLILHCCQQCRAKLQVKSGLAVGPVCEQEGGGEGEEEAARPGSGPGVCCWMGAAVLKPAKPAGSGKTRAGIERLRRELEERKREGASRSATAWDPAGAQLPALSGQARGTEHKAAAAPPPAEAPDSDDEALYAIVGEIPADLAVDYQYTHLFSEGDDGRVDVDSQAKIARVGRLMERPVDDAGNKQSRFSDREVRKMLSEAHAQFQRQGMEAFLAECRQRLDTEDASVAEAGHPTGARRGTLRGGELTLPHSYLKAVASPPAKIQDNLKRR